MPKANGAVPSCTTRPPSRPAGSTAASTRVPSWLRSSNVLAPVLTRSPNERARVVLPTATMPPFGGSDRSISL